MEDMVSSYYFIMLNRGLSVFLPRDLGIYWNKVRGKLFFLMTSRIASFRGEGKSAFCVIFYKVFLNVDSVITNFRKTTSGMEVSFFKGRN